MFAQSRLKVLPSTPTTTLGKGNKATAVASVAVLKEAKVLAGFNQNNSWTNNGAEQALENVQIVRDCDIIPWVFNGLNISVT